MKSKSYTIILIIAGLVLIYNSMWSQSYSNRYTEYKRTFNGKTIEFSDTLKLVMTNDTTITMRKGNNALGYLGTLKKNVLDFKYMTYKVEKPNIPNLILESEGTIHFFNREMHFDLNNIDYIKTDLPRSEQKYTTITEDLAKYNWKIFKILNSQGQFYEFEEILKIDEKRDKENALFRDTTKIIPDSQWAIDEIKTKNDETSFYTMYDKGNPSYILHSIKDEVITLKNTQNHQLLELQAYHHDQDSWVLVNEKIEMYMWVKKAHD